VQGLWSFTDLKFGHAGAKAIVDDHAAIAVELSRQQTERCHGQRPPKVEKAPLKTVIDALSALIRPRCVLGLPSKTSRSAK
jgi:hypothetical protein